MTFESILSVSELVRSLALRVRDLYPDVLVEGEISNLRRPTSGHVYLTLKDEGAQLRAVMWRSVASGLRFRPEDGQRVLAQGGLTVYEERGDVQLVITGLRLSGEGALQRALEALKGRLAAEGLFDPARKKSLPPLPRTVGIVTSGTGAALHDVLSILERRFPAILVMLAPVRVQGDGSADEIAEAIRAFNRLASSDPRRPDVLIVGRGGGSLEDLWSFNEEIVARAIHASGIPVVSAVGHESDVTIADLVADVRAATPSMAAELVVPTREGFLSALDARLKHAERVVHRQVDRLLHRLQTISGRLDFHSPGVRIQRLAQRTDDLSMRIDRAMENLVRHRSSRLTSMDERLRALDPLRPLSAGFAVVTGPEGVVRSVASLSTGTPVTLRFRDGEADATIEARRGKN